MTSAGPPCRRPRLVVAASLLLLTLHPAFAGDGGAPPPARFASLQDALAHPAAARQLDLGFARLGALPATIGALRQLEELDLNADDLTTLPPEIGELARLRKLVLANNRLTTLPDELAGLASLEELSLEGNRLAALPLVVTRLPAATWRRPPPRRGRRRR